MTSAAMADQGRWFKLWCSLLNDPALCNLPLEDFGRWAKLGALLKEQGTDGTVTLYPPAHTLCSQFQVEDFPALIRALQTLPHVTVTSVTNATVTMQNWAKYQGDYSGDRVREFRKRVTPKKRREEIRRDSPPTPPELAHANGNVQGLVITTAKAMTLPPDPTMEQRKAEARKLAIEAERLAKAAKDEVPF